MYICIYVSIHKTFEDGSILKYSNYENRKEIKYVLDNFTDNKILWVAAKKNIYNKCLILNDALLHSEAIKLKFEKINVVYKSNKHLIFNAKNIKYSNTVC